MAPLLVGRTRPDGTPLRACEDEDAGGATGLSALDDASRDEKNDAKNEGVAVPVDPAALTEFADTVAHRWSSEKSAEDGFAETIQKVLKGYVQPASFSPSLPLSPLSPSVSPPLSLSLSARP